MGFRKIEVEAKTFEEAKQMAPFKIIKNATTSWIKAGRPIFNGFNEFAVDYLHKVTHEEPGLGCAVAISNGIQNSRVIPYKLEKVKNVDYTTRYIKMTDENGESKMIPRKDRMWKRSIVLVDDNTNQILGVVDGYRREGLKAMKEIYASGYEGNITAYYVQTVKAGEPISFKTTYTPSKRSRMGKYILFGVE